MSDAEFDVIKAALDGDDEALIRSAAEAPPLAALSAILGRIHEVYTKAIANRKSPSTHEATARRLVASADAVRRRAGPGQRDVDLHLMRIIRHHGTLCCVLGAGVTMDAGGPSWTGLVRRLLEIGLGQGFEDARTVEPERLSIAHMLSGSQRVVVGHRAFAGEDADAAKAIAAAIEAKEADTEMLMRGAQMCVDMIGQQIFAPVTDILYEGGRGPGAIHLKIAELAKPIARENRPPQFGWSGIVTYNFDDLMGEALDRAELPRTSWAMKGPRVHGSPNERAKKYGERNKDKYVNVIHLHGFTPRRFFYITHVKFVFATSQYETAYAADERPILDSVFEQFLANPSQYALYVGCSFEDEYMNDLLARAYAHLPGREHWAMLRWPGKRPYAESTGEEIEQHGRRFTAFGVRPVWFDAFEEIPGLLQRLR